MKPILSPKTTDTSILSVDFEQPLSEHSILFEPPVYEELQCVQCGDSVTLVSSQSLLLNTKRLESALGYDNTKKIVDTALRNLQTSRPSLSSRLPSDFDYTQIIKDRNIQTPSELQSWIEYNQSVIDNYNRSAQVKKSWKTWFSKRNLLNDKVDEPKPEPKNE